MNKPAMRRKIWDVIQDIMPTWGHPMTPQQKALGVHLRGNEGLYGALTELIEQRMAGRANTPEPSDPLECKSIVARDRELQWLLNTLKYIYASPANEQADFEGEQPAA